MRSAKCIHPLAALFLLFLGCDRAQPVSQADDLRPAACDFGVYWPPKDPEEAQAKSAQALLKGTLNVIAEESPHGAATLRLAVILTRPSEEADREYWNSALAYSNVAWMEEVRVWDAKHAWLWPNLPFSLVQAAAHLAQGQRMGGRNLGVLRGRLGHAAGPVVPSRPAVEATAGEHRLRLGAMGRPKAGFRSFRSPGPIVEHGCGWLRWEVNQSDGDSSDPTHASSSDRRSNLACIYARNSESLH